jgi:hypothetical protein
MFKQPKRHGAHMDITLAVSTKGVINANVYAGGELTLQQGEALVEVLKLCGGAKTKEEVVQQGLDALYEEGPKA